MPKYQCCCTSRPFHFSHLVGETIILLWDDCCSHQDLQNDINIKTHQRLPQSCPVDLFSLFSPAWIFWSLNGYFSNGENLLYNSCYMKLLSSVVQFHLTHLVHFFQIPPFPLQLISFSPDVISLHCIILDNPGRWWRTQSHFHVREFWFMHLI